jgi:hypothetical protein
MIPEPNRPSPAGCVVGFFGLMFLTGFVLSAIAAFLAFRNPEEGIEWQLLAFLSLGLLTVTILLFVLSWKLLKSASPIDPMDNGPMIKF